MKDDRELLQQYTRERSEGAFADLVTRHIDLVYSAALRIVSGDIDLAQDVTQQVFLDLARKASRLPSGVVLAGWLHRHTSYLAANAVRTERRRKAREQIAMEMRALNDSAEPPWELIAPQLDDGLSQLSRADRDAIVLRFLKGQDLRAVGIALGVSDDAAQKRVSRALDKLRHVLSRRGVALTGAALASALTAQTVTAAPAGLAASVTAASLAGVAAPGTALTLLQIMTVTKLKAAIVGAIVIVSIATPLVLQEQAQARLRHHDTLLRERADQLTALQIESVRLSNLLAQTQSQLAPSADQSTELLRLRGEVARLRKDVQDMSSPDATASSRSDVLASIAQRYSERLARLKQFMAVPSESVPELQFLSDDDWLWLVGQKIPETEEGFRRIASLARQSAQGNLVSSVLRPALQQFAQANNGQFPGDLSQLKMYFKTPIDDSVLERWQILPAKSLVNLRGNLRDEDWVITQRSPMNAELDQRIVFSLKGNHSFSSAPPNHWDVAP